MAADAYQAYVERFESLVGVLDVGAYGKWNGKLVRKLSAEEFAVKHKEFSSLDKTYRGILERGDTINDAVVRLWRERRTELLFDEPQ
jgi:hypothetical protein